MTNFSLGYLLNSSAWNLFRIRDRIDMEPEYQREGDVWTSGKRKLLIDTIINGFDVPKIYMHKFAEPIEKNGKSYEYAVIDGKQRLSAIWDFIQGKFDLDEDFAYVKDETVKASNFTYSDLSRNYPDIKADFDAYHIAVVTIETKDIELIEDMFSRLNEAMPLNAAEKRNARPGPLPKAVRGLVEHGFFTEKLPFTNRRYRHLDLAAKMLLLASRENVADTKKIYIDRFFETHAKSDQNQIEPYIDRASSALDRMSDLFVDKDSLLRSVGMVTLYFILFERAIELEMVSDITRPILQGFEDLRRGNRLKAQEDLPDAEYDLLEFDRYTQSPNDAIAMRFRLAVIDEKAFGKKFGFDYPE